PPALALYLWSPGLEPVLYTLQQPCEEHAGAGDEHHRGEHLRRLERRAVIRDELADAVPRRDELRDDDARQRVADAKPESGQDEWHGTRQDDPSKDQRLGRAEGARDTQKGGVGVPHA